MSTAPSSPESDANLSGLGRLLLGTNEGSKPSGPWVPPTAEELHAILPQYEIVKMLGRGGMGAVYMGRQTALDRPVAIKILSGALEESDQGFTERFKNEARAMGKLNHPAIVSVYEFGQHDSGLLYIVMEYVDGTDVAKMIAAKGRLHTEHAMAITAHVCDALAYAHERGIIHRDIKPANIMVGYDGEVKVADFGLAKVDVGGHTLGLTQSGMAMGTLHFMAPEALMLGASVDHRADIYAVGVMLYQMLTGKLPQGMFKMPSLQVPGLDPRYDGIIAKAMMEDREARYQSAREMRSDLDGILTQPVVKADPAASQAQQPVLPTQARPQRPGGKPVMRPAATPSVPQPAPRGGHSWLWVAALGLLALGGVAWWLIQPGSQAGKPAGAEQTVATEAAAQITPVTSAPPAVREDAWMPLFNKPEDFDPKASLELRDGWVVKKPSATGSTMTYGSNVLDGAIRAEFTGVQCTLRLRNYSNTSYNLDYKGNTLRLFWQGWDDAQKKEIYSTLKEVALPAASGAEEPFTLELRTVGKVITGSLNGRELIRVEDSRGSKAGRRGISLGNAKARKIEQLILDQSTSIAVEPVPAAPATAVDRQPPFPAGAAQPVFTNSLGMKFVRIPDTRHLVCIHETRRRDYAKFASATSGLDQSWRSPSHRGVPLPQEDDHPVSMVSWEDAHKFNEWLGKTEKLRYRLPSSREWSILSGLEKLEPPSQPNTSGSKVSGVFPWGAQWPPPAMVGNLADEDYHQISPSDRHLPGYKDGFQTTAPVMRFKPSSSGVYDLAGNVAEFCRNLDEEIGKYALVRGSSFDDWLESVLTSAQRAHLNTFVRHPNLGFRVVIEDYLPPPVAKITSPTSVPGLSTVPLTRTSPLTWIDTKGRSIQAKFVRLEGANVLLDIAGKVAPVALNTLSAVSQQQARDLQAKASEKIADVAGSPAQATKDQPFVNSLGMKFVPVPGTKVLFCVHETRRKDFAAFAAQNTSVGGNWKIPVLNDSPLVGEPFDQHPVAKVSRDDAESFCKWLSGQSQYSYRLPTDEEWSKAAGFDEPRTSADTPDDLNTRAVSGTAARIYPWGTEWPPPADAGNYSGEFTSDSDNFPTTSPAMSFGANKYGLHDLGGNVWEWVSDQYWNKDALSGTLRGGGWDTDREWPRRSGSRFGERRNVGAAIFGFRVVLELPDGTASVAAPVSPVAWIDAQGRRIEANFVRLEGANVLLDIAGKVTPVPLNTLSAASQQQARELQSGISTPATPVAPAAAPSPVPNPAASFLVHSDDFDDGTLSSAWRQDGVAWHCLGGELTTTKEFLQDGGDKGGGIWLMRDLPVNFRVQFKLTQAERDEAELICEVAGRPAEASSRAVPGYRIHFQAEPKSPQVIRKGTFTLPGKAEPYRGGVGKLYEHVVIERRDGKTLEYRNGNLLKATGVDSTPIPTGWLGFHFVKGAPLINELRIYDLDQGTPPPVDRLTGALPSGLLTGQVKDNRNKPAGGTIVRLIATDLVATKADAIGRFAFKNLTPGNYLLRAEGSAGEVEEPLLLRSDGDRRAHAPITLKTTRTFGIRWVHQTKPGSLSLEGEGTVAGEAWFSTMHHGFVMSRGGPPDRLTGALQCDFSLVMNGRKVTFGSRHGSAPVARLERVPFDAILAADQGGPLDKQGYFPNPLKSGDNLKQGDAFTVRNETDGTYGKVEIMHVPN